MHRNVFSVGTNVKTVKGEKYGYTNQKQIRAAFWDSAQYHINCDTITRRKLSNGDHTTDTRCAFVDFVDMLARDGQISEALAQRVTL
jgi:hypothetical protein